MIGNRGFLVYSGMFSNDYIVMMLFFAIIGVVAFSFLAVIAFMTQKSKKNIEKLYNYDELTAIYNKNGFYKYAANLLRLNSGKNYCVAAIDVYRFKIINEIYGRDFGDKTLKQIADCVKEEFQSTGVFCRLGSDIFMVCIPFEFDFIDRLKRLNDKVEAKLDTNGEVVLTIGVYVIEDFSMPVASMCDRAYMASKSIKGSFVTRFAMYDDNLRENLLEERELTSHMLEALEKREFRVVLQPKYSLDTEKVIGAEALIRWFHPQKGLIMPGKFIPIFERNGLILHLDIFVLESVCEIISGWKAMGKKLYPISINISRRNILQVHIAETIKDVVDVYGLDPSLVNLEITESAYMDNPELLNKTIAKLRSYGFVISIDDFGSGYSSLNTLKDVPVDVLKIDLKFLLNFDKQSKGASILSSVVRMAKALNMVIIAEGVETKEQASFLRSLGCDSAQGYYYSKPISVKAFEDMTECRENIESGEEKDFISDLDIENFWENNADMNTFLRNILGGFGIYEIKDGVIKASRVNDAYFDFLGCSREDYYRIKENVIDWIYPADRGKVTGTFLKTLESHLPEDTIYRRIKPDGSVMWVKSKFCFIAGNSIHSLYYAYFTDITGLIQTEKSLRVNEAKYKLIMENLQDMILEWHKKTDNLTLCRQFKDKFGFEDLVIPRFSKNFFKIDVINEEDKEKVHAAFFNVYYGEPKIEIECRINRYGSGDEHVCKVVLIRVEDETETNLIIVGIVTIIN